MTVHIDVDDDGVETTEEQPMVVDPGEAVPIELGFERPSEIVGTNTMAQEGGASESKGDVPGVPESKGDETAVIGSDGVVDDLSQRETRELMITSI